MTRNEAVAEALQKAFPETDIVPADIDWVDQCFAARGYQIVPLGDAGAAGWQPIETAPKDDQPRLLYNGNWIGVGWYHEPYDGFSPNVWVDETDGFIVPHPTHWQPLPAAPKPDTMAGGGKVTEMASHHLMPTHELMGQTNTVHVPREVWDGLLGAGGAFFAAKRAQSKSPPSEARRADVYDATERLERELAAARAVEGAA